MKTSAGKKHARQLVAAVIGLLLFAALMPQAPAGATYDWDYGQNWTPTLSMYEPFTSGFYPEFVNRIIQPTGACDEWRLKAKWRASGQTSYQIRWRIREATATTVPYHDNYEGVSGLDEDWGTWTTHTGSTAQEFYQTHVFNERGDGFQMGVRVQNWYNDNPADEAAWSGWSGTLTWARGYRIYLADAGLITINTQLSVLRGCVQSGHLIEDDDDDDTA